MVSYSLIVSSVKQKLSANGRTLALKNCVDPIASNLLEKLENDGFIHTITDKDGQKELIPVSELIAKALRETKSQNTT